MSLDADIALPESSAPQPSACPNCGARRIPDSPDCPTCGVIFAKYRAPEPSATPEPAAPARNHFEAPKASLVRETGEGHWRDGKFMVLSREVDMTDRCVKCGEAGTHRKTHNLRWHKQGWYLLVLVNLFFYILISMLVSTRAKVGVSLCAEHRARQVAKMRISLGVMAVSVLMIFHFAIPPLAALPESVGFFLLFGGMVTFVIGLAMTSAFSQTVAAHRIDKDHIWLRKCGPGFLDSLPQAPSDL